MSRTILGIVAIAAVVLGGAFVYISKTANDSASATRMKIGYLPVISDAPLFVAKEKGFFAKYGIDAELIRFPMSARMVEALLSGSIDSGGSMGYTALLPFEEKNPGSLLIYGDNGYSRGISDEALLVKPDSGIKTLNDLRGKKVVVGQGPALTGFIQLILGTAGLSTDDVELIQAAGALRAQTFARPDVSAIFSSEPFTTTIIKRGIGVPGPTDLYCAVLCPFPAAAYVLPKVRYEQDATAYNRMIAAVDEAIAYLKTNPDDARTALPKYLEVDAETAKTLTLRDYHSLGDIDKTQVQKLSDILLAKNMLEKPVDTAPLFIVK